MRSILPYGVSTYDVKSDMFVLISYASIGQGLTFLVVYLLVLNLLNLHYSRTFKRVKFFLIHPVQVMFHELLSNSK